MARKTIQVGDLLERANFMLRNDAVSEDEKSGIAMMIETVLHATDNYSGFSYVDGYHGEESFKRHYHASKVVAGDVQRCDAERCNNGSGLR